MKNSRKFKITRLLGNALLTLGLLGSTACDTGDSDKQGCASDADCKGSRVCSLNMCVDPNGRKKQKPSNGSKQSGGGVCPGGAVPETGSGLSDEEIAQACGRVVEHFCWCYQIASDGTIACDESNRQSLTAKCKHDHTTEQAGEFRCWSDFVTEEFTQSSCVDAANACLSDDTNAGGEGQGGGEGEG